MSLWYTGKVGEAEDLNKSFNVSTTTDIDDETELPSTVGEGILAMDNPSIHITTDGESWTNQIPVIVDVPATATSTGRKGQFAADASGSYLYYCPSDNVWVRATFATF